MNQKNEETITAAAAAAVDEDKIVARRRKAIAAVFGSPDRPKAPRGMSFTVNLETPDSQKITFPYGHLIAEVLGLPDFLQIMDTAYDTAAREWARRSQTRSDIYFDRFRTEADVIRFHMLHAVVRRAGELLLLDKMSISLMADDECVTSVSSLVRNHLASPAL